MMTEMASQHVCFEVLVGDSRRREGFSSLLLFVA